MKSSESPKRPKRQGAVGAVASNLHEGSRSEVLADYLFSAWGTVSPVRRQDDIGIDLHCALTERVGWLGRVTDYYSVQVKSTDDSWKFGDSESVKWLVQYPQPLFLAHVEKKLGVVRVFHVAPRFTVGLFPPLPSSLELTMEDTDDGSSVQWTDNTQFSLSAPILRVGIEDLLDKTRMTALRSIFQAWVRIDWENCSLFRHGLLRYRMPSSYKTNELPSRAIVEMGLAVPGLEHIARGILNAAESAECRGGQLGRLEDRKAALFAAFYVDHLVRTYKDAFQGEARWTGGRLPADLGMIVTRGLNNALKGSESPRYLYEGLDSVLNEITSISIVAKFLAQTSAS
jgi:hypothetical protein